MSPELWQKLKPLIQEALTLPTVERASFVAKYCHGDSDLNDRAMAFLERDETTTQAMPTPLIQFFERGGDQTLEGQEIGEYLVERELGRGGMGVVLLARERDNDAHKVALKFIRSGGASREKLLRFQYERLILSELDHVNIATLLDGGTTHEGVHYLVMEYVEGQPIDRYCDRHQLSLRARLELFLKIGHALIYAHQRQVVHLDIKPSNILVSAEGEPVLLDFGIARMSDPESIAYSAQSIHGQLQMTPEYASPEQVQGQPANHLSDIYSLGVLLYEVLAGFRPYQLDRQKPSQWVATVCEAKPLKPSKIWQASPDGEAGGVDGHELAALRSTTPKQLHQDLKRLDVMIMKALAVEPERRFRDSVQMIAALTECLEDRPMPASWSLARRAGIWFKEKLGKKT